MAFQSVQEIVETGSFTSKDRLTETIEALTQRSKFCRDRMAKGIMSVTMAANEIEACNTWIECFKELKNSL